MRKKKKKTPPLPHTLSPERERERDRQTDRQTDRGVGGEASRQTDRLIKTQLRD